MIDFSQKTALLGGSFDPIHTGHLHIANEVLRLLPQLNQIIFVPASQSPGKHPAIASAKDRLQWLSHCLPSEQKLKVWDIEINRPGESFTVDTLKEAHQQGAQKERLFWILGSDAYKNFSHWRDPAQIRQLCTLIVVCRPGTTIERSHADDILLTIQAHPASSTAIRKALADGHIPYEWLPKVLHGDFFLNSKNPYAKI